VDHESGREASQVVEAHLAQSKGIGEAMEPMCEHIAAKRPSVRSAEDHIVVQPLGSSVGTLGILAGMMGAQDRHQRRREVQAPA
jgi:hypothetical protein